jgi:hypothetical protein
MRVPCYRRPIANGRLGVSPLRAIPRASHAPHAAAHRAQADALEIEAGAKRRLADKYDAARERGEILSNGERSFSSPEKVKGTDILPPSALSDLQSCE